MQNIAGKLFKKIFKAPFHWAPYAEIAGAYAVLDGLNLIFNSDPGFRSLTAFHPYWIVVLLAASRYGMMPGFIAGLAGAGHLLYFTFGYIPERAALEKAQEAGNLWLPFALTGVGMILGEIRQRSINEERRHRAAYEAAQEALERVEQAYRAGEKARQILESRIVSQSSTLKTVFEDARKLETAESEKIFQGCLDILASHFQIQRASVFVRDGDHFILKASVGWPQAEILEARPDYAKSILRIAFEENRTVTVRDILRRPDGAVFEEQFGKTLVQMPLRGVDGKPMAVVNIEKMDFLAFHETNLNLMQLVVDWAAQMIISAGRFETLRSQMFWKEEAGVYTYAYFHHRLEGDWARAHHHKQLVTLTAVKIEGFGFLNDENQRQVAETLLALLRKKLSKSDHIFEYRFTGTFMILSPAKEAHELAKVLSETSGMLEKSSVKISWKSEDNLKTAADSGEWLKRVLEGIGLKVAG